MNDWIKLINEYKGHNEMLQEMLKEKNEEIHRYREAIENALDEGMMSEFATQVMLQALEESE